MRGRPWTRLVLPVLAAHVVALGWVGHSSATGGRPGGQSGPRALQVRTLTLSTHPGDGAASATVAQDTADAPAPAPAPSPSPSPALTPTPTAVLEAATPEGQQTAPPSIPSLLSEHGPGDGYLPRAQLSVGPRPHEPVKLPFPDELNTRTRHTGVLALFIDERGVVRRVRAEGDALPPVLEAVATQAFLDARFKPGEVQGQPVKSLIRVEVVFDNTAVDHAAVDHAAMDSPRPDSAR